MNFRRMAFFLLVLGVVLNATPATALDRVWVATIPEGQTIEAAWTLSAEVFDRTPEILILGDANVATTLTGAGWTVDGPFDLDTSKRHTIGYEKGTSFGLADIDFAAAAPGARVIWARGRSLLAESTDEFPHIDYGEQHRDIKLQNLRKRAVRRPIVQAPARDKAAATAFKPIIADIMAEVDSNALKAWVDNLTGENSVLISGNPFTITTRWTDNAQCDTAERYVLERFQAMGIPAQFDPYSFSGTNARNVVATITGSETPNNIYIIGSHLDSRAQSSPHNPAPGANDNASGTAAVLHAAEILKDYEFKSTIKFIAFTGEEQGLFGSEHYAAAAATAGDNILGVVNCDMIAWYNAQYQIDIEGENAWAALMQIMDDACTDYTTLNTVQTFFSFGSDHVPFQNEGFPAFLAIESEYASYPCYHVTCDTSDNNKYTFGWEVTKACIATIAHLADPVGLSIQHTPLANTQDTVGPYAVTAVITSPDPIVGDSLRMHYSLDGGGFTNVLMTPTGGTDEYSADIPGQSSNTTINYYVAAADSTGRSETNPSGAPGSTHEFFIGSMQTIKFQNFESGVTGWSHGGSNDDWELASPQGLAEDPGAASSGTMAYGNDLTGLGASAGKYENNSDNWLQSPPIDCTGYTDVKLSFERWLSVERSNNQQWDWARVLVNGNIVWESPSGANLIDASWTFQEIDISVYADNNASVVVRFELHSDVSLSFGGWTIDDFKFTGIGPPTATDVAESDALPRTIRLFANTPNPFNPTTSIRFALPAPAEIELAIYDIGGRRVKTLTAGHFAAGEHTAAWTGIDESGRAVASGIYFYRLTGANETKIRKMMLVR